MPKFAPLIVASSVFIAREVPNLLPELSKLLSSASIFLISFSSRATASACAAQAFAGGSPGSPLMAVAA
jgi:hypothetical protein